MAVTDPNENVVEKYEYKPYGAVTIKDGQGNDLNGVSAIMNPYMFTARRYDEETGLYHYRHRAYDPNAGRFLQRDPLGYVDGANLFEYVGCRPTTAIDPLGLNPFRRSTPTPLRKQYGENLTLQEARHYKEAVDDQAGAAGSPDITHHWGPQPPDPSEVADALLHGDDVVMICHYGDQLLLEIASQVQQRAPRVLREVGRSVVGGRPVSAYEARRNGGRGMPEVVVVPDFSGIGTVALFACFFRSWREVLDLPLFIKLSWVSGNDGRYDEEGNLSDKEFDSKVVLGDASKPGSVAAELAARKAGRGGADSVHVYYGSK